MSKYCRKTLAIVLTLCLVFTLAVPSFAYDGWGLFSKAPEPTKTYNEKPFGRSINYVAFGDSQTDGYYMPDYFIKNENGKFVTNEDGSFMSTRGFNTYVSGSYPDLFSQHLAKLSGKQVNLYAYAADAMRYEDLYKLFDSSFEADDFYREYFDDSDKEVTGARNYMKDFYRDEQNKPIGTYDVISKNVRSAVQNADVISMALGTNSFGNFFSIRATYALIGGEVSYGTINKTKYLGLSKVQKYLFDTTYELVMEKVESIAGEKSDLIEKIDGIVWDAVYAYTGFATGVESCLEKIEAVNPDATVMLVGLSNAADGIVIDYKGIKIDIGIIAGVMIKAANSYLKSACEKTDLNAIYVEPGTFDKMYKDVAALDKDSVDFNSVMGNLMGRYIQNTLVKFGKEMLGDDIYKKMIIASNDAETGKTVEVLNAAKIENGVVKVLGEDKVNRNKTEASTDGEEQIGQIYLGIRDAIIDACNNTTKYDFETVLKCFSKPGEVAETLKNAYTASQESALRTKIHDVLLAEPGVQGYLSLCVKFIVHSAGSHINLNGHASVANEMIKAYDKALLKGTAKTVIKNAVPIMVGGAIVTYVSKDAGKRILSGIAAINLLKKIQDNYQNNSNWLIGKNRLLKFL